MVNPREMKDKIQQLLNEKILQGEKEINEGVFLAPYDFKYNHNPQIETYKLPTKLSEPKSELFRLLREIFGHSAANPSNPGNREKIHALYTFPEEGSKNFDESFINRDYASVEAFVKELCSIAQSNATLYRKVSKELSASEVDLATSKLVSSNESKFIIVGDRGVGKTTLINFILDEFIDFMDSQRVVAIRMDLTKPFIGVGFDNWFIWQFCAVLFKYYDHQKMDLDLNSKNEELIDRFARHCNIFSRERLKKEYENVRTNVLTQDDPQPIHQWVFRGLYDYVVIDKNISFVFMVDGLDKLGLTRDENKEYELKLAGARKHIFHEKARLGAYLVTMRRESYFQVLNDPYRNYPLRQVADVPAEKIYDKKITCLEKKHLFEVGRYPNIHKMNVNAYIHFVREVGDAFIKFVAYSLSTSLLGISNDARSKAFEILENIFGPDKRALFRSLTVIVEHFLYQFSSETLDELMMTATEKEIEDTIKNKKLEGVTIKFREKSLALYTRYYMLIEALLLSGESYFKNRYRWYFAYDRDKIKISNDEHLTRSPVFYNIFTYPYIEGKSATSCLFTSVRILQFVYWRHVAEKEDLIRFLNERFRYDETVMRKLWDELLDAGLIKSHRTGTHSVAGRVTITQLGEFTIQHLIMTLEYIALSLETAPLPQRLVEGGFIPIVPYNDAVDFVVNNKFKSTINFLRILQEIEKVEEERFNSIESNIKFSDVFRTVPRIIQGIIPALNRIIDRAYEEDQAHLVKELEKLYK
jgi:hypothetical protein